MGLFDLTPAEMEQVAGLLGNMPTFSGRRNPVQPMANYWMQAGERAKAEKARKEQLERQKRLDDMKETEFSFNMFQANNNINRQAMQDKRAGEKRAAFNNYAQSFNPQSNLFTAPGVLAGQDKNGIDQFRLEQGLLGGVNPKTLQPSAHKPTNAMINAQASGLVPGTPEYNQFIQDSVLKPSTVINNMKAPSGYQVQTDAKGKQTLKPIEGGPVYEKALSEYNKQVAGFDVVSTGLEDLKKKVQKFGTEFSFGPFNSEDSQMMSAAHTALFMDLKTLFELGALQGPDIAQMEKMLIDPASAKGLMKGDKAILQGIQAAQNYLDRKRTAVDGQYSRFEFKKVSNDKSRLYNKYGLE